MHRAQGWTFNEAAASWELNPLCDLGMCTFSESISAHTNFFGISW